MQNEAKMAAQESLFTAIASSAENIMKAALRGPEKAGILRDLAEAYRLTAGGSVPDVGVRKSSSDGGAGVAKAKADDSEPRRARQQRAS